MTQPAVASPANTNSGAGIVFAFFAAASAALFLFLPVVLIGFTASFLAGVLQSEPVSRSSATEAYGFLAIPTVISLVLLFIPYRLFKAAKRRMGAREAVLVVAGLLAVWHAAVATFWAWGSTAGFSLAPPVEVPWYSFGFCAAAVIAAFLVDKRAGIVAALLVVVLGLLLSGIVRAHSPVPLGAQQVEVEVTTTGVRLSPASVPAGDIYLVLVTPRSSINVTQDELVQTDVPSEFAFDLTGCTDAQRAADRGQIGYCGNVFKVNLAAGKWAVISTSGDAGKGFGRLEVLP
jgi:hypothetical protein